MCSSIPEPSPFLPAPTHSMLAQTQLTSVFSALAAGRQSHRINQTISLNYLILASRKAYTCLYQWNWRGRGKPTHSIWYFTLVGYLPGSSPWWAECSRTLGHRTATESRRESSPDSWGSGDQGCAGRAELSILCCCHTTQSKFVLAVSLTFLQGCYNKLTVRLAKASS